MSNNASFTPPSLLMATIGLSLATFMQVLDTTIANVALPTISGNLGVSSEQGTWVITSFAVSNAIALPLTGWLSRRFGEVKLFLWATILFVLASFLCGISTSMPELIGFRVLQGLVAGPLYPMTQTLLIAVYPPARRGMALALLAMVTVVAPIAGPILGGWITDSYSWPWNFFNNVTNRILLSRATAGSRLPGLLVDVVLEDLVGPIARRWHSLHPRQLQAPTPSNSSHLIKRQHKYRVGRRIHCHLPH